MDNIEIGNRIREIRIKKNISVFRAGFIEQKQVSRIFIR